MRKEARTFIGTLFDILVGLIAVPQILYYAMRYIQRSFFEKGAYEQLPCIIVLVTMLFFSFSLFRTTVTYNELQRCSFIEKGITTRKERLRFLFSSKQFYFKAGIVAAVYLIFPLNWTFEALRSALNVGASFPDKLAALAILFPVLLVLAVLAHLSAYKRWIKKKENSVYRQKAEYKEIILICSVYALGAVGLFLLVPVARTVGKLLWSYITFEKKSILFVLIIAALITLTLFRIIRIFVKRRTCIQRIKKTCAAKGYTVSKIKKPYLSLFCCPESDSFQIRGGEKTYSCKLISARRRHTPLVIMSNGSMQFLHIFHIRSVKLFRITTTHKFGYASEHPKILIVNPIPKKVYTVESGKTIEIDNGHQIGDYTVYSSTAFVRALELDVLNKK